MYSTFKVRGSALYDMDISLCLSDVSMGREYLNTLSAPGSAEQPAGVLRE